MRPGAVARYVFAGCLAMAVMADGTAASTAQLARTDGPITIDGVMDEPAWRQATRISIDIETRPGENIPARVETTAYLLEDGEHLFIAFDARDPDPEAIRAYLRDRDSAYSDDFVGIVIDTYNDQRRAFEFFANPLGVQMDLTNDDVRRSEDDSWDAIWDSAGRISGEGYVVEMEIPLSQLRFPFSEDLQTWGIDLLRFYPRDQRYRFSNNPMDRNRNCYLCQLSTIQGLEGVEPGRDLEIVPTLTGRYTEFTDDPGITALDSDGTDIDAGVNVRWGISPDLTANFAINPDFSQVEADVAQLDVNNQFALFFPEKRPFFLEGADYFNTPVRAVFTRTVADPDVGAKLTGKRGNHTYGVYGAQDAVTNLLFPGPFGSDSESLDQENSAFVGRYSYGFGNASSVGALLTARRGDDYANSVGGFDARWKFNDQHSLQLQFLRSETEYPDDVVADFEQPDGRFPGHAGVIQYDYDSRNWFAYLHYLDRSAGFRADLGFVPRVDANMQIAGLGRTWYGGDDDSWTQMRLHVDWDVTHDDSGRQLERELEAYYSIGGPMQSWFEIGGLTRDVLFDNAVFQENKLSVYGEIQPRGGLLFGVSARIGDQVDFANTRLGDERRIEPFVHWNVNRHLFMRIRGTFVNLDSKQGPKIFDASVLDARLTWQFNRRSFLRVTLQHRDVERNLDLYVDDDVDARSTDLGRQLLFSYKINPQTVFFLGYSDRQIDDDTLDGLTATDRTWFMKVGYAWTP